jgi:hypothetical protein
VDYFDAATVQSEWLAGFMTARSRESSSLPNSRSSCFHCPKHSAAFSLEGRVAGRLLSRLPSGRFDPDRGTRQIGPK